MIQVRCASCQKEQTVFKIAYEKGIGRLCPGCFYEKNKAVEPIRPFKEREVK